MIRKFINQIHHHHVSTTNTTINDLSLTIRTPTTG
jgi:hypothetical protein